MMSIVRPAPLELPEPLQLSRSTSDTQVKQIATAASGKKTLDVKTSKHAPSVVDEKNTVQATSHRTGMMMSKVWEEKD